MESYKKQFHIRYLILKFTVRVLKDCILPVEKASAIRGGFGNCLLELQCISDIKQESCKDCTFHSACIVQNIMYAPLKIPVNFIQERESEGYSIYCLDKRTEFCKGDSFSFSITLFGDVIVYLQPILQAFFYLGTCGLGKERAKFEIIRIENQFGQNLFKDGMVYLNNYKFQYLEDYILYRIKNMQETYQREKNKKKKEIENLEWNLRIKMLTPLSLKYHGILLKEFHIGGFINALSRRTYIMNCFEGQEGIQQRIWQDGTSWNSFQKENTFIEQKSKKQEDIEYLPEMKVERSFCKNIRRYSMTQKRKMSMNGITGEFLLYHVTPEILWYLLAGEILQVGKYTSFGFGRYYIERI